jgi:hypothetical protein
MPFCVSFEMSCKIMQQLSKWLRYRSWSVLVGDRYNQLNNEAKGHYETEI